MRGQRNPVKTKWPAGLALALALVVAALAVTAADFPLLSAARSLRPALKGDLYYLLRIWGTLWTWLLFATALLLAYPESSAVSPAPPRRITPRIAATLVALSPGSAGLLAELLKLILRRERPSELELYAFRSLSERPWSTSGLGLPSSHAAVAFGGSLALITIFPRLRWPALLMASGCAFTRIASGAHYPSDVLAGAAVGWAASLISARWIARPAAGRSGQPEPDSEADPDPEADHRNGPGSR